ncbi:fatty acyl-AMP ligase [Corallococcus macrosporus]|uniref:Peptide synthetase n=1 Tax=Corallococcus macrosporus DSM 14697 TaxID=1189310 RepID=A0A250JYZ2_9BACT|nr:fatty acyl-AMP ligase [Corallococcus macrosporus]ATB48692.1 peptide synthetase [Corallococcus macrosporus DSM 14697]
MPSPSHSVQTLTDLLRWRASNQPEANAYTYLQDGEGQELTWTYRELDRQARAIAAALQEHKGAGERALLLYPPGLDYIAAFFGSLYAGVAAVPAYPPAQLQAVNRILSILQDAKPRFALTTREILESVNALADAYPVLRDIRWIATDALEEGLEDGWKRPAITGDSLAFLQYTSGSTSTPKGVMVLHRNLMSNESMIQQGFSHDEQTTVCGWLPLYHDMGLIGTVLQPMYMGVHSVVMSPWSFLQRPIRWLSAITKYRATTSGGPNFAYALCTRKVKPEQLASLDLSSWRVAFNGAEPVRAETLSQFADTFAPAGFRREAFYPCYGLAEATLFVSGGLASEVPRGLTVEAAALEQNRVVPAQPGPSTWTFVSAGRSWGDCLIRIVNPETLVACAPNEVGEIWTAGPHVTHGYWGREDTNAETFQARIQGSEEGPFLRTGDLGFMMDGELYVTGRIKDLIIVDGRNHYPQDIELTAERQHEALRPGCSVAFSVDHPEGERLVVLVEVNARHAPADPGADASALQKTLRQAVAAAHSVDVHEVVLLQQGEVLKTSSGKVQRRACKAKYQEGSLQRWPA